VRSPLRTAVSVAGCVVALAATAGAAQAASVRPLSLSASSSSSKLQATPAVAPVPARPADRLGVSSHFVWFSESYINAEMQRIRASGVHWVRDDFNWNLIEARRGTYDWTRTDNVMTASAKNGVDVLAILTFSPTWASTDPSGAGDRNYPPSDPADYARFAAAVAARYGAHGAFWAQHPELVARPLTAVELWNEPWGKWAWRPNPSPAAYARLARGAAAAVRATDPAMRILLPADLLQVRTDGTIVPWFETLLKVDPTLLRLVSALSVHPYPGPREKSPLDDSNPRWAYSRVLAARTLAMARGYVRPVWITEIGWSSADPSAGGVGEAQQAIYLRAAVNRAFTEWQSFVPHVFVYTWSRGTGTPSDWDGNLALLGPDGSPKPAWAALQGLLGAV